MIAGSSSPLVTSLPQELIRGVHRSGGRSLKFFEALYEVERLAQQTPSEGETRADYTLRLRQRHSLPALAAFKTWLDDLAPKVLPESLTGKAISYAQSQWDCLIRYTCDGLAP